jgi:hypothetical protein
MGTYKNKASTLEAAMRMFMKDLLAILVLGGFTVSALTWTDIASRLV